MAERKNWYVNGVNGLCDELKSVSCNTLGLARVLYIYNLVDQLMKLCRDYKKCENYVTKGVIKKQMDEIISELHNYKVFDERFTDMFDDGKI